MDKVPRRRRPQGFSLSPPFPLSYWLTRTDALPDATLTLTMRKRPSQAAEIGSSGLELPAIRKPRHVVLILIEDQLGLEKTL
jgi:hypothetical protein